MEAEPAETEVSKPLWGKGVVAAGRETVVLAGIGAGKSVGAEAGAAGRSEYRTPAQRRIEESVATEQVHLLGKLIVDADVKLVGVEDPVPEAA